LDELKQRRQAKEKSEDGEIEIIEEQAIDCGVHSMTGRMAKSKSSKNKQSIAVFIR
jgi:hypothetical protein